MSLIHGFSDESATKRDHTVPDGRWTFDDSVAAVFDDMLARSIPQYDVMRDTVTALACAFQSDHTAIVDLGASRGEAIAPLVRKYGARNQFVAVEVSEPMREAMVERFDRLVDVRDLDLRHDYPPVYASVTMAILTMQFVPIEYRQRLVANAYRWTLPGGAFIVVEKVLGADADIDDLFVERYLALKAANGYSAEEIDRKRLSLEGVLVPLTAAGNESLLRGAGFRTVDCFWRWLNFAGWIALR